MISYWCLINIVSMCTDDMLFRLMLCQERLYLDEYD